MRVRVDNNRLYNSLTVVIIFVGFLYEKHEEGVVALTLDDAAAAAAVDETQTSAIPPTSIAQRLPPPRVRINKCCHFGEYLDKTRLCVAGSSEHWVPLIFLINRKIYHTPQGSSPKFITFEDNELPVSSPSTEKTNNTMAPNNTGGGCTVDELEMFTGSTNIVLFSNGSLFLPERAKLIAPNRYCVDREAALVCFPKAQTDLPQLKLRKCCGKHGTYNEVTKSCHFDGRHESHLKLPLEENSFQTIYGFPDCEPVPNTYGIAGDWSEAKLHKETGFLHLHKHRLNLTSTEYCLEHVLVNNAPSDVVKIIACLHHFVPDVPANSISASIDEPNSNRLQLAVLNVGIVISVVFLAATLVASYMIPSIHHMLHWRCQVYYVFCLFVGDLLLAYTQFSHRPELNSVLCRFIASAMHFFFLAAFFWLNTMCFNIWWTFRDFRPSSLERNQEVLRLRLYSAYAWGIPLVISVIAVCVDLVPDSQLLRPGFGVHNCWFSGEHLSIFAYFFGPVGILLCVNIILFISTTHQLTCGLWKRDDVKSTTEKTALGKVCLKLVVVMGVTWIADVLSWLIGGPDSAWFFTDLINALQGVFIFIVVGCQPQVWAACKRFCCPRLRQEITNTTNGVQHSSSSQGLPSMAACAAGAEVTQNTSAANTTITGSNKPTTQTPMKIPMETVC